MYSSLTDAVAREHRLDLLREAATRSARRDSKARTSRRGTRNGENHAVATVARSLGHPFTAFHGWYAAGQL